MKPRLKNDPAQLLFPVFVPVNIIATGGGTFKVEMGRPVSVLKPSDLAKEFGVDRDTVYLWIGDGTLPHEIEQPGKDGQPVKVTLVERAGKRKHRIYSPAIAYLRAKFNHDLHQAVL